jgi:hypothetical protein
MNRLYKAYRAERSPFSLRAKRTYSADKYVKRILTDTRDVSAIDRRVAPMCDFILENDLSSANALHEALTRTRLSDLYYEQLYFHRQKIYAERHSKEITTHELCEKVIAENLNRTFFLDETYVSEWEHSFTQDFCRSTLAFGKHKIDEIEAETYYLKYPNELTPLHKVKLLTNIVPFPYISEHYDTEGAYRVLLSEERRSENEFIPYFVEYSIKFAFYVEVYDKVPKKCCLKLPDVPSLTNLGLDTVKMVQDMQDRFPNFLDQESIGAMESFFRRHNFSYEYILKMYDSCNELYKQFGEDYYFWFECEDTFRDSFRYRLREPDEIVQPQSVNTEPSVYEDAELVTSDQEGIPEELPFDFETGSAEESNSKEAGETDEHDDWGSAAEYVEEFYDSDYG